MARKFIGIAAFAGLLAGCSLNDTPSGSISVPIESSVVDPVVDTVAHETADSTPETVPVTVPETTTTIALDSPFDPSRLRVSVLPVSTRITDRSRTLPRVVAAMAREYRREPGNYLAFFSSFDYLQQAYDLLREQHPDITAWPQTRTMTEAARSAFLGRFTEEGEGIGLDRKSTRLNSSH